MAMREIVVDGDPILRKKSRPVEKFDEKLATLLDDMAETMYFENRGMVSELPLFRSVSCAASLWSM